MQIKSVETFVLHVPVTRNGIADSTHSITHWGVPGAKIETECGRAGFGFAGTHAHLPSDRLITDCIEHSYGPLLIGRDPREVRQIWTELLHYPPLQWVGRAGITHLALAAVDIALWDLKAKDAGLPLWNLLGGSAERRVPAYNTDGGWLNFSQQMLVDDARHIVEELGFCAIKIKVGKPDPAEDLRRIEAVRNALGPDVAIMTDANGRWDIATAVQAGRRLGDFDITWIEEPLWHDDVQGHARLAQAIDTPIALGEQLYTHDHFNEFMHSGGVHYVQPDVTRLAGVTEWWTVAEAAHSFRLPVTAHAGDMAQVQRHLSVAHPACINLEFIPWIRECFTDPATVVDGVFLTPTEPGAGTTPTAEAVEKYRVK